MAERISFHLDPELKEAARELKRTKFAETSWAELYRYLLTLGIETEKAKKEK